MFRYVLLLVIVICCSSAFGKSIFDDDYAPPKESPADKPKRPVAPENPPDVKPQSKPRPPREPQSQPDPAVPSDPASPSLEPAPVRPPAENSIEKASPEKSLAQDALESAQESFRQAEATAEISLEKDKAYVAARQHAKLDEGKGILVSPAVTQAQHLRDAFLARDVPYQDAKRYITMLTRSDFRLRFNHMRNTPPKTQEEFKKEIAASINDRNLMEGMTFQEACKVARRPVELISKNGTRKTYHWVIKGPTGSYQEEHRSFRGGVTYETVNTYGVIGYVEGIFDDDYLVSFSRAR